MSTFANLKVNRAENGQINEKQIFGHVYELNFLQLSKVLDDQVAKSLYPTVSVHSLPMHRMCARAVKTTVINNEAFLKDQS